MGVFLCPVSDLFLMEDKVVLLQGLEMRVWCFLVGSPGRVWKLLSERKVCNFSS